MDKKTIFIRVKPGSWLHQFLSGQNARGVPYAAAANAYTPPSALDETTIERVVRRVMNEIMAGVQLPERPAQPDSGNKLWNEAIIDDDSRFEGWETDD